MTNLILFAVTVSVYHIIHTLLHQSQKTGKPQEAKWHLKSVGVLMLLCAPFNFDGTIVTVLGNAESKKSVYSVSSLYQKAEYNAFNLISLLGYQHAGNKALNVVGISAYQHAENLAINFITLSGYQNAVATAINFAGVSAYQNSEGTVGTFIGISVYQNARRRAEAVLALVFYQKVENKDITLTRTFGVWSFLGDESAEKEPALAATP